MPGKTRNRVIEKLTVAHPVNLLLVVEPKAMHKSSPLGPVLIHLNSIHALTGITISVLSSHLGLGLPNSRFLSGTRELTPWSRG